MGRKNFLLVLIGFDTFTAFVFVLFLWVKEEVKFLWLCLPLTHNFEKIIEVLNVIYLCK